MSKPKLNFAHLCDNAFLSQDNKLNIIGIFREIYSQKFPFRYPKMAVVMNVTVEKGMHPFAIHMMKEGTTDPVMKMQGEVKSSETKDFNLIIDLANIAFEDQRKYRIDILMEDEVIGAIPFEIKLMPQKK